MHDRFPLRSLGAVLLPLGAALAAGWLAFGPTVQDAVFAALKLAVTR